MKSNLDYDEEEEEKTYYNKYMPPIHVYHYKYTQQGVKMHGTTYACTYEEAVDRMYYNAQPHLYGDITAYRLWKDNSTLYKIIMCGISLIALVLAIAFL